MIVMGYVSTFLMRYYAADFFSPESITSHEYIVKSIRKLLLKCNIILNIYVLSIYFHKGCKNISIREKNVGHISRSVHA